MTNQLLNVVSQQLIILNNLYSNSGETKAVCHGELLKILGNRHLLRKFRRKLQKQLSCTESLRCLIDKVELSIDVTREEKSKIFNQLEKFSNLLPDKFSVRKQTSTKQSRYLSKYGKRLSIIYGTNTKIVLLHEPILIARQIKLSFNPDKLTKTELVQFFKILKTALGKDRYMAVMSQAFPNVLERAIDLHDLPKMLFHVICDKRAQTSYLKRDTTNGLWCEFERLGSRDSSPLKAYDIPARICRLESGKASYKDMFRKFGSVRLERVFYGHSQSNNKRIRLSLKSLTDISQALRGVRIIAPTFFLELTNSEKMEVLRHGLHAMFKSYDKDKQKRILSHECTVDKAGIESAFQTLMQSLSDTIINV